MTAPGPSLLSRCFLPQLQARRTRVFRTPRLRFAHAPLVFGALLLVGLTGFAFLGQGLIYYRKPVFHFNPTTRVGTTEFRLLQAELYPWQGGPSCTHYTEDRVLIQTSATRFEDIITYAHRMASPNDHDLVAVFVQRTIPGQPWQEIARHPFRRVKNRPFIPANWVARLFIRQGGIESDVVSAQLLDLRAYSARRETWLWQAKANYHTDSITEQLRYAPPDSARTRAVYNIRRRLTTSDALYYSPYRTRVRK